MAQEKRIENLIKNFLTVRRLNGDKVFFYKQFQVGGTPNGLPDVVCCIAGRFVGVEVKAPSGTFSDEQKIIAKNILKANGVPVFCDDILMFRDWYNQFITFPFYDYKDVINLTRQVLNMEEVNG